MFYSKLQERLSAQRVRCIHMILHKALKDAVQKDLLKEDMRRSISYSRESDGRASLFTWLCAILLLCWGTEAQEKSTTAEEGNDAQPSAPDAYLVGNAPAL